MKQKFSLFYQIGNNKIFLEGYFNKSLMDYFHDEDIHFDVSNI